VTTGGAARKRSIPPAPAQPGDAEQGELESLADVVARLRRALRRSVRVDVPFESLSVAQVELMQYLAENPGLRASDLAERLLLAPTTISTLLNLLLSKQIVERRPDASDRRAWHLHLTATGIQQLAAWQASNEQILRAALHQLGDKDRTAIRKALPALNLLVRHLDGVHTTGAR
jgi:DNA-binding MarR family transcriptional regulator